MSKASRKSAMSVNQEPADDETAFLLHKQELQQKANGFGGKTMYDG